MESVSNEYGRSYVEHLAETKPHMLREMIEEDPQGLLEIVQGMVQMGISIESSYADSDLHRSQVREIVMSVICPAEDEIADRPMSATASERIYRKLVRLERANLKKS